MVTERSCDGCSKRYEAKRPNSRFCSTACRVRMNRAGGSARVVPIDRATEPGDSSTVAAVRAEMEDLGKADSPDCAAALSLAARLDHPHRETGSSLASVSRELRAVRAEARISAKPAGAIAGLRLVLDRTRAGAGGHPSPLSRVPRPPLADVRQPHNQPKETP